VPSESTVERSGLGRVPVALLVLLVPVSIVIFGLVGPALASQPGVQPVTETDQKLLIAVRQAGLWEIPAGRQAKERAASEVVKEVGAKIAEQHIQLDRDVRVVADRLGVALPNQPNEDQKRWLAELDGKYGAEFDRAFAQLLRAAHGKVFATIAQVRAGTRNDTIREFASQVNDVVKGHMTMLESTGQVNYDALPEPAIGGAAPAHSVAAASARTGGGVDPGLVAAICLVEAGVTVGLIRLFRSR
jgi:predicted outer membrane protein